MMFFSFWWSGSATLVTSALISVVGEAFHFLRVPEEKEAIICLCESLIFGHKSQKLYGDRFKFAAKKKF